MKPLQKGLWKTDKDNIDNDNNNNITKEVRLVFGANQHFYVSNELKPSICQKYFCLTVSEEIQEIGLTGIFTPRAAEVQGLKAVLPASGTH